jgi:hypothetical protein
MGKLARYVSAAALVCLAATMISSAAGAAPSGSAGGVPRYRHIFVIVEENHGFSDVIGNPAAPNLNALAARFGLETRYFGVSHPSEPNYVGLLGGSVHGVASDDPYYMNRVHAPSLITQLDGAHISWRAYLQGLPYAGYKGICYPAFCNGAPDKDPLYVSKHDGIQNFVGSLNRADWSRQTPISQLSRDVASGHVPAFSWVVPDECHDQHGDPPYCIDGGNIFDPQDQHLVGMGDAYLGRLVSTITHGKFWSRGNNAIVITYDEGDDNAGCCDAKPGGGQVATVVITSHGPRNVQDAAPANHYSLLATIQHALGVGCIANTCDTAHVHPLAPLFGVTGSRAVATKVLPIPNLPTPTPTPVEPRSQTQVTATSAGWSVLRSPLYGVNDNSLGSVAGGSSDDWAVGNFLPDGASPNQDATLALADRWHAGHWSVVPTPNAGPNFNTLFGVAASGKRAWAVGVTLDARYRNRALVEAWNGAKWSIVKVPQPGSQRDILFAASATSARDVWAVGDREGSAGVFRTLVEHYNGRRWRVVPSPDPGSTGDNLYGVSAVSPGDVWAVGEQSGAVAPDHGLIEHWNGHRWSVVRSPRAGSASVLLDSVSATAHGAWAVGETDGAVSGARPLAVRIRRGEARISPLPPAGSIFTSLFGVTVDGSTVWADGTFMDAAGNEHTLMLRHTRGWHVVNVPNPGSGDNIFGGIARTSAGLLAVGAYDTGNQRLTLIQRHR